MWCFSAESAGGLGYADPWLHHDTTTIALYGAYDGEAPGDEHARPAYGHSKDGRADLKQVLLSLGVSGDGGLPLRLGIRDGNTNESTETPVAIEECLALGLDGVLGMVADSKAYSRRTLGLWCEKQIGLVTLVPRTCAVRQALEAWGRQQTTLPLLLEKPGRTAHDAPRRWRGRSVSRNVEVEDADKRVAWEEVWCVAVHSTPLAYQQAQASSTAQAQEAQRLATPIAHVATQRFVCATDAEAALAADEGRERGRRGRPPQPWRYQVFQ